MNIINILISRELKHLIEIDVNKTLVYINSFVHRRESFEDFKLRVGDLKVKDYKDINEFLLFLLKQFNGWISAYNAKMNCQKEKCMDF